MRSGIFLTAAALAATVSAADARPLEAELPLGETACFERVYDEAHLAAHPKQKAAQVRIMHLPKTWTGPQRGRFYLMLQINLRKRTGDDGQGYDYSLGAFCKGSGQALDCVNEWDAGAFSIERAPGGLLVKNRGLIMNPDNYDAEDVADDAVKVPAAPDDKAWLLAKAPDAGCKL